jgi:phenylacetate-CoA ligase
MRRALGTWSSIYSVLSAPRATRAQVLAMQTRRLRHMVRHAYANVPFYRGLFDRAGVAPGDIRSLDDLPKLPIVTKAELVAASQDDLLARGSRRESLVVRRTSGSSGPIFTMVRSRSEELVSELQQLRIRRAFGLRLSDVQVVAVMDTRQLKGVSLVHRLANRLGVHRTHMLSPLLPPEDFVARLETIRPDVLLGLAGPVARLATVTTHRTRERIHLRHVITTGEVLTMDMRRALVDAFGAPVYDKYVCAELGHIAWQCPESGELHTCDEHLIVEVVRDGRPVPAGERGELVATSLHFEAMPFIRYKLADVVTRGREHCSCGQPFATIRAIEGRMIDYFHLPDGRVVHPYQLGAAMQQTVNWVKEFQLIQERRDLIVANIVPTEPPLDEEVARVAGLAAKVLSRDVELRIVFVDRIQWGATGKLRPFRSLVSSNYDNLDWTSVAGGTELTPSEASRPG